MNGFAGFLGRSLRGVRLVEFAGLILLLALATGVYLAKAAAGRERADITQVQAQIDDETKRLRLLQAEVAHLEEPGRLGRLAAQLDLGPPPARHEGAPDDLNDIAHAALIPAKADKASSTVVAQVKTGAPQ